METVIADKTAEKQQIIIGRPFIKGQSGNPNGRPKGSGLSITTIIKQELETIPEGEKSTYLELLVKKILDKAIGGDFQMIRQIWNYIDGMPNQKIRVENQDNNLELSEEERIKIDRVLEGLRI